MTSGKPMRARCGIYQWHGKKPFRVGTVLVRNEGTQQEIEKAVEAEFIRAWGEILPDDMVRPNLVNLQPGAIWFAPEEERAAA